MDVIATHLLYKYLAILKDADLSTLSGKRVRKQLEEKYGEDLTER